MTKLTAAQDRLLADLKGHSTLYKAKTNGRWEYYLRPSLRFCTATARRLEELGLVEVIPEHRSETTLAVTMRVTTPNDQS